jgi:radical SAM protein with 4Fe4S-binding SPASM domain
VTVFDYYFYGGIKIKLNLDTPLRCPGKPYVFEFNNEMIFFSPETNHGVRVNRDGAIVLQAIKDEDNLLSLAERLTGTLNMPSDTLIKHILPFLEKIVKSGYLSLNDTGKCNINYNYNTDFHPSKLYLHVTKKCNLSCIYCYNKKYRSRLKVPDLKFSDLISVLNESKEIGIEEVVFTGGEPLLRPEILKLANFAQRNDIKTGLITNGTLIENYNIKSLAESFDFITVSLDSCYEDHHDRLRGRGSFQQVMKGLKVLCKQKKEGICLRPVVTTINIASLSKMPQWAAEELGCGLIIPTMYVPNSFAELNDLGLFVDENKWEQALREFNRTAKEFGVTNILDCLSLKVKGKCGAGSQIISIDSTGDVYPCQGLHFSELCSGNIKSEKLYKLGQSLKMRQIAEISVRSIAICHDCGIAQLCGGGCRAAAYSLYRDVYAYNEFLCPHLRKDVEDALWKEGEKGLKSESMIL